MQQATVNLLADMDVQPATLQAGLVAATASTDTTAADLHHHLPGDRRTRRSVGTPVTITGTATDAGGGVVAGVEVSTDGGATWHPANGTSPGRTPGRRRSAAYLHPQPGRGRQRQPGNAPRPASASR